MTVSPRNIRRRLAGFVLLEAVIALLIVAMACMTALEGMQLLQATAERFRATAEGLQARRNALALVRHLERTTHGGSGNVVYGPFTVTWRATRVLTYNYRLMTAFGLAPPATAGIDRLVVESSREGRLIDRFEILSVAPAASADPASSGVTVSPSR